mmetsp:Transcript_15364/g.23329  ORF Transcript_15364/g.23329 Transcript_15364/m.23329 type:complete len:98 (-) Transcript_15364:193-486(-)
MLLGGRQSFWDVIDCQKTCILPLSQGNFPTKEVAICCQIPPEWFLFHHPLSQQLSLLIESSMTSTPVKIIQYHLSHLLYIPLSMTPLIKTKIANFKI